MKYARLIGALLIIVAGLPIPATASDVYWAYTYEGISVINAGHDEHAKLLAHDLHRLDLALRQMLSIDNTDWRPPTTVFSMPDKTFALMKDTRSGASSLYQVSSFQTTILLESGGGGFNNPLFGAYFGFAGSLLNGTMSMRYPKWLLAGLSEVLGASSIERGWVIVGGFEPGRVRSLASGSWIPAKTLLGIHEHDPQMASQDFQWMYAAESWLLVHQIMIENQYRSNFLDYFSRLDQGESETQAFSESFSVPYEDIDKMLHAALAKGRLTTIAVQIADDPDTTRARALSNSEAKGLLAIVATRVGAPVENILKLARESLTEDPKGPNALIAISIVQLRDKDYPGALQTAGNLCATDPLPQPSAAECGNIYAELAYNAAKNPVTSSGDVQVLSRQARTYFEAAITVNPEDIQSWSRYSDLLVRTHDVEDAKLLLPRIRHEWATHSRNEELARTAADLCETTGDYDSALQFALVWRRHALSGTSRDRADAYVSRLKTYIERKRLAETPSVAKPALDVPDP